MATSSDTPPPPPPEPLPARRKWDPPQIESGQLFEANSLSCGKGAGAEVEQCMMMGGAKS
jgi:hypothetical protein